MNKKTVLTLGVALALLVALAGCDMFTTSMAKSFARDSGKLAEAYKEKDTNELLALVSSGDIDASTESKKAVLSALGSKEKEEIDGLKKEQKEEILGLVFETVVDISAKDLADTFNKLLGGSGSTTDEPAGGSNGEQAGESPVNEQTKALIEGIFDKVQEVDPKVATAILENPKDLAPSTVVMASVAVIASTAKFSPANSLENKSTDELVGDVVNRIGEVMGNDKDSSSNDSTTVNAKGLAAALLGADADEVATGACETAFNAILSIGLENLGDLFSGSLGSSQDK